MTEPQRLLFLAPIVPSDRGNGLAMRCAFLLDAYAREFAIDLAVVPLVALDAELNEFSRRRVRRAEVFSAATPDSHFALIERLKDKDARLEALRRYGRPALMSRATGEVRAAVEAWCGSERYAIVHVFRLYLAELAGQWIIPRNIPRNLAPAGGARCVLDCDEDDAAALHRIARMHAQRGDNDAAAFARVEAEAFARLAGEWLPRFDRVLAAAPAESRSLSLKAAGACVRTIPNTVAVSTLRPCPRRKHARSILFVGNMSYAPNADAVLWFAQQVWPRLCRALRCPLRLLVVGAAPPREIARLDGCRGITVTGAVADVRPFYAVADLAIVPLRAGGGTRIKLLEAAERGVPLVSTTFGAAGTRLRHKRELLIADDPAAFARACTSLLADPRRAAVLAARARTRVRLDYDAGAWAERLNSLVRQFAVDDRDAAAC